MRKIFCINFFVFLLLSFCTVEATLNTTEVSIDLHEENTVVESNLGQIDEENKEVFIEILGDMDYVDDALSGECPEDKDEIRRQILTLRGAYLRLRSIIDRDGNISDFHRRILQHRIDGLFNLININLAKIQELREELAELLSQNNPANNRRINSIQNEINRLTERLRYHYLEVLRLQMALDDDQRERLLALLELRIESLEACLAELTNVNVNPLNF